MARLLGYGSIACCVDEMLNTVNGAIQNTLAPYVQSLLEGMPKECKAPPYAYGSFGALGYYQLKMQDIVQYKDLQTNVFHAFREIGNGLIVFMMLEQSITCEEVVDLAQSMPFQGALPASIKKGEDMAGKLRTLSSNMAYMNLKHVLKGVEDNDTKKVGSTAEILTKERMCIGLSMFTKVLQKVKESLSTADKDAGQPIFVTPPPINDVMDIDECNQFHRLWSVIMYSSCTTAALGKSDQHREWFGDGMQWAGCAIIALMEQRERFEAFDFTYHIINAWDMDKTDKASQGVSVTEFVKWAKKKRTLNDQIFSVLDKYLVGPKFKSPIKYYPPPSTEGDEETLV